MKKIIVLLLTTITLVCSFALAGCGIKKTAENCYNVSIYEARYTQNDNGEVVFKGAKLEKSFQVLKSQMFEIDKYEEIEEDGEKIMGKYCYTNLPSYTVIEGKKLQVLPTKDTTIMYRKREKKDINLYYKGKKVLSLLEGTSKEEYMDTYLDVYNEDFEINGYNLDDILTEEQSVVLELYTNQNFSGEPFATKEFTYYSYSGFSGSMPFTLIKTTDVYIKVKPLY